MPEVLIPRPRLHSLHVDGVAWRGTTAEIVRCQPVSTLPDEQRTPCAHARGVAPFGAGGGKHWTLPFALVTYDSRGVISSVICAECVQAVDLAAAAEVQQ